MLYYSGINQDNKEIKRKWKKWNQNLNTWWGPTYGSRDFFKCQFHWKIFSFQSKNFAIFWWHVLWVWLRYKFCFILCIGNRDFQIFWINFFIQLKNSGGIFHLYSGFYIDLTLVEVTKNWWQIYFDIMLNSELKGTLMQIWKSPYMFVFIIKTIPWKFRFHNPKNSRVICPWNL